MLKKPRTRDTAQAPDNGLLGAENAEIRDDSPLLPLPLPRLSDRLLAVASLVTSAATLADIGTDHAALPIYLVRKGLVQRVIATDCSSGSLAAAAQRIARSGLAGEIELRQGWGLKVLVPGEVETLVVTGLGAKTIVEILQSGPQVLNNLGLLLLQPMGEADRVRRWLCAHNWFFVGEDLVLEGKHFYEVVVARPGTGHYSEAELEAGPLLLKNRHPLLQPYLEKRLARLRAALSGLYRGLGGISKYQPESKSLSHCGKPGASGACSRPGRAAETASIRSLAELEGSVSDTPCRLAPCQLLKRVREFEEKIRFLEEASAWLSRSETSSQS